MSSIETCLQEFEKYKVTYSEALTDLSMKEGLGKKFGGPRRHAQERIRSEVNQSTASESEINSFLNIIETIGTIQISKDFKEKINVPQIVLDFELGSNGGGGGGGDGDTNGMSPEEIKMMQLNGINIDQVLLRCILCLRKKLVKRGKEPCVRTMCQNSFVDGV